MWSVSDLHMAPRTPICFAALSNTMGKLQVTILGGKRLSAKDMNGYSDPYIKVKWCGQKFKTSTKHKTLNPTWNETFIISIPDAPSHPPLDISVWDWDKHTSDDAMGSCQVFFNDLRQALPPTHARPHLRCCSLLAPLLHLAFSPLPWHPDSLARPLLSLPSSPHIRYCSRSLYVRLCSPICTERDIPGVMPEGDEQMMAPF